ncbi:MAG: hypothetical protein E6G92_13930 [Alphaproteobacteria bacterium]|nr:MAG: hypothetical protein E6G92_13930 [Alphaproteobacteria bacterium]
MRKMLLLAAAASALGAAAPAAAQYYSAPYRTVPSQYGVDNSYDVRISQLHQRLDAGIRAGTIDSREAYRLRRELDDLARVEQRLSYNGLTESERFDLQRRIRSVRQDMRYADGGAWDRNERYGYDDRAYGAYGAGVAPYGAAPGYYGQGGPYEEVVCESRSGVGALIDSVFGRDCFRVGQRVPSNLYAVPSEYRSMYRDGYGTYYRSDGRAIYEIDARTNTVLSVHPLNR